ncbi:MAG: redox-sensing transcriptional repressor Rex [Treponema sp.]|jgi:redox-sensing transcriptional repressor|nr:redox-sensing transcriptional repressor Rex [Treponema sp.]
MEQIPGPAKERLLHLMRILEQAGEGKISSAGIETLTGWARDTIRKDISWIDGGECGGNKGYDPAVLVPAVRKALGLDRRRKFCVVGLGRLGSAYLNMQGLDFGEFELTAGFDSNVNRVEILKSTVPLYPAYKMAEVITRFGIEIALLCVPSEAARSVADRLVAAGIQGIINFSTAAITVPPEIAVRNVSIADELRGLAIRMKEG